MWVDRRSGLAGTAGESWRHRSRRLVATDHPYRAGQGGVSPVWHARPVRSGHTGPRRLGSSSWQQSRTLRCPPWWGKMGPSSY